ncbi:MAG: hypothetical protein HKN43_06345 [Rhodothermales bacterium]|nr:hypothetical protein [Rhodothermales bacterium]
MKRYKLAGNLFLATMVFVAIGCDSNSVVDEEISAVNQDAAESIAVLQGEDTGGLMEEVQSVFEAAQDGSVDGNGKSTDFFFSREYDDSTGTWTVTRLVELGEPENERYLYHKRVFEIQFRDSLDNPQIFYNTSGNLASSIEMTIVEAEGVLITPNFKAEKESVSGNFLATGTDTEEITVNGTYAREGSHTLETENAKRTLDFEMSVNVIDLVGPRGSRRDLSQKVSGTIEGEYHALVTFERGDAYGEREIDRSFTIVIEEGEATITIEGDRFESDLQSGELRAQAS